MKQSPPFEYEIVILNASGFVVERVEKIFNYQGFPLNFFNSDKQEQYFTKTLERSQQMS